MEDNFLTCHVIGGGAARGICGSGLVDAVAAGLELDWIQPSGRLANRKELPLTGTISLQQADVRELQLLKGAIAAGLHPHRPVWRAALGDIQQLHLAGAFGNYISRASAKRIGLLGVPRWSGFHRQATPPCWERSALFEKPGAGDAMARRVEHVALHEDPGLSGHLRRRDAFPGLKSVTGFLSANQRA